MQRTHNLGKFAGCRAAVGGLAAMFLLPAICFAQSPLALKICEVDDRSGAAADTGNESFNALRMVVDAANAKGGIDGKKIEVIAYDGKTDPQLTATYASRCAEDDKALLIIGGNPSAPAASMIPVAEQNRIPYYILSASAENLTDNAVWHFRFGTKVSEDGKAVADALASKNVKTVGIINNALPFGTDGARGTSKALDLKGIKTVAQQTYEISSTDVTPQVVNLRAANPDVIVAISYPADAARVVRTIRQLGMKTPVIVVRSGVLSTFLKLAGDVAEGVLVPTTIDLTRPEVAEFYAEYGRRYPPIPPAPYAALGWDAATLAVKVFSDAEVIKAVNSGDLALARKTIRDATERLGKFEGMQGKKGATYQFGPGVHHGPSEDGFYVMMEVVDKGRKHVVSDLNMLGRSN